MGMYDTFETDENMEKSGVIIDYGDFRVKIASAGQGNKSYVRYAEKTLKPVRRAMEAGSLDNSRTQKIMADIYATTVILEWEVSVDGKWVPGIEPKEKGGDLLPVNKENVVLTLLALPRMFMDLQEQAMSLSNFRKAGLEEDAKN